MATLSNASDAGPVAGRSLIWLRAGVIVVAVLGIYLPAFHGGWLWDDNLDITENVITQSPTGLWKIWFEPGIQYDYYPIKASVQWMQWHLWGMNTLGYHLTNIFLHGIDALLVWHLFSKFRLKFAWLGGLIFAIHPANVESVAWIAELKNTLSLLPFLLSMCAWIDYDQNGKRRDYFWSWAFFFFAMLCKTTMALFPLAILLYAWWRRNRIALNDVKLSAPFFAVSLALGWVTLICQSGSSLAQAPTNLTDDFLSRLALAGLSLGFYFFHCLWPVGLLPVYPQWTIDSHRSSIFCLGLSSLASFAEVG